MPVLSCQAAAIEIVVRQNCQGAAAVNKSTVFSPDYATARLRFRQAANRLGWTSEPHAIGRLGPNGEDLTIDVAWSENGHPSVRPLMDLTSHEPQCFSHVIACQQTLVTA